MKTNELFRKVFTKLINKEDVELYSKLSLLKTKQRNEINELTKLHFQQSSALRTKQNDRLRGLRLKHNKQILKTKEQSR
jgi:hypothetical protein